MATPGEPIPDDVEYLFWVGCAGAIEDRSKEVTRAFAELLHIAGVPFVVLGVGEPCDGDPARRIGNEYLYQELAKANIETLNGIGARKIVATCPHCFNTVGREYGDLGGHYEMVHHTQLLGQLVAEGRLTPVQPVEGLVTYTTRAISGGTTTSTARPVRCWQACQDCAARRCTAAASRPSRTGSVSVRRSFRGLACSRGMCLMSQVLRIPVSPNRRRRRSRAALSIPLRSGTHGVVMVV